MSNCCNEFEFTSPQGTFYMDGGIRGKDGVTFYPHVSAAGVISWTNDGGKQNPDPVNIKGADGMSAYAAAQEAGFTGTEQEFNAYLSGIGELTEDVDELKSAVDGYCNLDFSDVVNAYFSTQTIGDKIRYTSSTKVKTIKRITQVKQGYIYKISVTEGDTLAITNGYASLLLADSEEIIFQNDIYFLNAGQTDTFEFTAFGDGYLYLGVDSNYKSVLIEGSSVFQAQKVSENSDYKITYLAETGRLIVIRESIRAYRYAAKHFGLPAGTYHFHCDSVASTDTDSTVCLVNLGGGSTPFNVNRGVAIDVDVVLPNNSSAQYFYASDGSSHSNGDRVAYNNVIISKVAYSPIGNALIDENSAWTD